MTDNEKIVIAAMIGLAVREASGGRFYVGGASCFLSEFDPTEEKWLGGLLEAFEKRLYSMAEPGIYELTFHGYENKDGTRTYWLQGFKDCARPNKCEAVIAAFERLPK
jgi:hypothetical protein